MTCQSFLILGMVLHIGDYLAEQLGCFFCNFGDTAVWAGAGPEFPTAPAPTASATCCAPAVSGKPGMPPASVPVPRPICAFRNGTAAGVFLELWRVGLERFDELQGLDWSWLSMDGAMTKSPLGGGKPAPIPPTEARPGSSAAC